MHTATDPARNQGSIGSGQDTAADLMAVVADMMSLIVQVQASTRLIESAIHRDCEATDEDAGDVVILDDVTPCYAKARDTLAGCKAGLDAALQSLLGTLSEAKARGPAGGGLFTHIRVNGEFPDARDGRAMRPSSHHWLMRRPCAF